MLNVNHIALGVQLGLMPVPRLNCTTNGQIGNFPQLQILLGLLEKKEIHVITHFLGQAL